MIESRSTLFQENLGYTFKDLNLLQQALLHPSLSKVQGVHTFERLEFLGDRILGLIIAAWIYTLYPLEPEGNLARRYSTLVGRSTLGKIAKQINLNQYLLFDQEVSQKRHEETILADGCEALIGALFLDGGLTAAQNFIHRFWTPLIDIHALPPVDPKSALQEWAQGKGKPIPSYVLLSAKGPDHSPEFEVAVHIEGFEPFTACGYSKRNAEKCAAEKALAFIEKE